LPFLERGWPLLVDMSTTDLVYPSSCVASSRGFVKSEPKLVENFLRAYVAGIQVIRKEPAFAERSLAKWLREKDAVLVRKTVEAYSKLFKPVPNVHDKGLENVIKDLQSRRTVPKEFLGHYDLFRDNGPLERALARQ
jgi:ABC-type nitrate/sulfonate/bicarbonate transport system substrate-binding protein